MANNHRQPATGRPLQMPLEALPPEIWRLAILHLDDHCFAWHVLRRVSPFLRQITEDVFAALLVRDCTVRLTGEYARSIVTEFAKFHAGSDGINYHGPWRPQFFDDLPSPGFTFKVTHFSSSNKDNAVLKLQEHSEDHEARPYHIRTEKNQSVKLTYPFALRQRCCACPSRIQSEDDIAQCDCFRRMFFSQSRSHQTRMAKDSHFVRFDAKLSSLRIPSLSLDEVNQELSFDWRDFLHDLYLEELKAKVQAKSSSMDLRAKPSSDLISSVSRYSKAVRTTAGSSGTSRNLANGLLMNSESR
ncbi:hypothetical protein BDV96DRAFT_594449 [Lophiotrema nucula]|uniref:F-box domain-containing protein n=1 Tax=Lophiotrema nucula TaxID=690887 RepID=A0A6A5ZQU6_9PLEO|nr:hypothetical protein BDV96DRAFT_594449 [Lophiotrema nucula]